MLQKSLKKTQMARDGDEKKSWFTDRQTHAVLPWVRAEEPIGPQNGGRARELTFTRTHSNR